jgi:hypothetical protein
MLPTFDAVMRELGGVAKVARLTNRSMASVCNWRAKRERFPTTLYFVMIAALQDRGCYAPRSLWGFEQMRDAA